MTAASRSSRRRARRRVRRRARPARRNGRSKCPRCDGGGAPSASPPPHTNIGIPTRARGRKASHVALRRPPSSS
eukprot:7376090-Prymnesium_polylepis.1